MPSHFKFKEYCPLVFRNLRERFSIDDQDFQVSFVKEREMIQSVMFSVLKPQHTAVEQHKTPVYSLLNNAKQIQFSVRKAHDYQEVIQSLTTQFAVVMKTINPHNNTVMSELSLHPPDSHVQMFLIISLFPYLFHRKKYLFQQEQAQSVCIRQKGFSQHF